MLPACSRTISGRNWRKFAPNKTDFGEWWSGEWLITHRHSPVHHSSLTTHHSTIPPLTTPPLTKSISISMKQPVPDRHPQNAQIEPGRPVRDVIQIELDAFS